VDGLVAVPSWKRYRGLTSSSLTNIYARYGQLLADPHS
jgi:hypothetical protein